jgi:catabolite regulation protein CreA
MPVPRFYAPPCNTRVYLDCSDHILEGSPKNILTIVVLRPWDAPWTPAPRH